MHVRKAILNYQEDIIRELQRLIQIPSVRDVPSEGKPFGEGPYKALEAMLELGERLGFRAKNVDGYAGHVEFGEGEEIVGVLVHLDVVPAGEGWTFPPFGGVLEDGAIYGRGASDNKGPAIVALYGLKALKNLGIRPQKRIRIIFGTDEESGMTDMDYYFSKEPVPDMGFSPDAGYPITNREKGLLRISFTKEMSGEQGSAIRRIHGGSVVNMVPDTCEALVDHGTLSEQDLKAMKELAGEIPQCRIEESSSQEGTLIRVMGKSAHGAGPEDGVNAVSCLLHVLAKGAGDFPLGDFLTFLSQKIGLETRGESMGIACMDEPSGELTLNLGILRGDGAKWEASIDIRYPVTCSADEIVDAIRKQAEAFGISVRVDHHMEPLYVPDDHPLIVKISRAYEMIMGEKAELQSMGGGTYARTLRNNGVAFGASFRETGAHQPDEFVLVEDLMLHGQIFTQALYELAVVEE
ncbi:MAG: dipeptidase PepV [Clostridia bacterium]